MRICLLQMFPIDLVTEGWRGGSIKLQMLKAALGLHYCVQSCNAPLVLCKKVVDQRPALLYHVIFAFDVFIAVLPNEPFCVNDADDVVQRDVALPLHSLRSQGCRPRAFRLCHSRSRSTITRRVSYRVGCKLWAGSAVM